MKPKLRLLASVLVLTSSFCSLPSHASEAHLLGQTVLNYAENDLDILRLGKCPPHRLVRAIKVRVLRGTAEIEYFKVTFANGDSQSFRVRENVVQGRTSRWVDLKGNKRCITSITVLGDTDNRSRHHAVLQVFGK
jgi:Protein of unknown function (DUF2541)